MSHGRYTYTQTGRYRLRGALCGCKPVGGTQLSPTEMTASDNTAKQTNKMQENMSRKNLENCKDMPNCDAHIVFRFFQVHRNVAHWPNVGNP